jgi:GcrA cell cycle regulator
MMIATWTAERVEQLQAHIGAGLTCSQIAAEIGVSRNAVIGKIHRLGIGPGRSAAPVRQRASGDPGTPRTRLNPRPLRRVLFEQAMRAEAEEATLVPVDSPQRCSLLELAHAQCRWPLNDPREADFAFCGNESVAGFSYCPVHARMAYRFPSRRT